MYIANTYCYISYCNILLSINVVMYMRLTFNINQILAPHVRLVPGITTHVHSYRLA